MTATLLLPHDAPREEWLAARRAGVTASEIATILGISPWDSAFNLFHRKLAIIPEDYDDDTLSLGRHLEPWIADRWEADHQNCALTSGGLFACRDRPWQIATPDFLAYDHGGDEHRPVGQCKESGLEVKHSGSYDGWGETGTDEIPVYYRAQCLWQMDVMDWQELHVTCFFLATRQRRDYVITYDEADVEVMRAAALDFLARIERREPPPIDGHTATRAALSFLSPKVDPDIEIEVSADLEYVYSHACDNYRRAKTNKAEAENLLRYQLGSAKTAVTIDGRKVASRSIYEMTGIDRERLRREFPEAYMACRTTTTVDKLIPARPPKDMP